MTKRSLKIVILGLSLSSAWGNGHATTYRSLIRGLAARGHDILFLERDVPWYAAHRDLIDSADCKLRYYDDLAGLKHWESEIASADAVIIGSFVPDGIAVANWVFGVGNGKVAFYDIDTPVTLTALAKGTCTYLSPAQIRRYALYLSFTGGPTLDILRDKWRATAAHALYCSVDPEIYKERPARKRWDLGYLGTYSADRQPGVQRFILEVGRRLPEKKFVVAGAQFPDSIEWPANVDRFEHIPPSEHLRFYTSLGWALNLTRADMRGAGYSPSVRLFEAAACGTPIISDDWPGLETFFVPEREIAIAHTSDDVIATLQSPNAKRTQVGLAGRKTVMLHHTAVRRAAELEELLMPAGEKSDTRRLGREATSMDYL